MIIPINLSFLFNVCILICKTSSRLTFILIFVRFLCQYLAFKVFEFSSITHISLFFVILALCMFVSFELRFGYLLKSFLVT